MQRIQARPAYQRALQRYNGSLGRPKYSDAVIERLVTTAVELGVSRLFCLTFEVDFFTRHGFEPTGEQLLVDPEVYAELVRSPDEGIAEFLDLAREDSSHW